MALFPVQWGQNPSLLRVKVMLKVTVLAVTVLDV
jgi:hypothetical protein